jgi:hypothetical protein
MRWLEKAGPELGPEGSSPAKNPRERTENFSTTTGSFEIKS